MKLVSVSNANNANSNERPSVRSQKYFLLHAFGSDWITKVRWREVVVRDEGAPDKEADEAGVASEEVGEQAIHS